MSTAPATLTGIDYSTTSPAACFYTPKKEGQPFSFEDCKFLFLTGTNKYIGSFFGGKFQGLRLDPKDYETQIERYDDISDTFLEHIDKNASIEIGIEDYAMAAKGMTFNIGENTGILKLKLKWLGRSLYKFAPTEIKKFATGKGNADKDAMNAAFMKETGINLREVLKYDRKKCESPLADIVDSYYICKYLHYFGIKESV